MSRWWRKPVALCLSDAGGPPPADALPPAGHDADAQVAARQARLQRGLAAFATQLDALALPRGTRVRCWLAADVARLLVVPWHDGITSHAQRVLFAQHCFREVYGPAAADWEVRVSPAPRGKPALASAADRWLVPHVEQLLAARRLKPAGVRPLLMEAFNRALPQLGRTPHGWFVLCEPPWITLLWLRDACPQAVRRVAACEPELPRLLEREQLSLGIEEPRCTVWVMRTAASLRTHGQPALDDLMSGWPLQWLEPLLDASDDLPPAEADAAGLAASAG